MKKRFITPNIIFSVIAMCALMCVVGCKGGSYEPPSDEETVTPTEALSPAEGLGTLSDTEKIIFTPSYAGRLTVHFDETIGLRMDEAGRIYSKEGLNAIAERIEAILDAHPAVKLARFTEVDEVTVDARRAELEMLSGKRLADWNSVYYLVISDPNEAVRVLRAFNELGAVSNVYPDQRFQLFNLSSTPDLTSHQGYLYDSSQGGLNATHAWSQGIYGQDVTLVDVEAGWNINHDDLPLSQASSVLGWGGCFVGDPNPACPAYIAHGTAVVGILGALDNGHGTTGFAHSADIKLANAATVGPANIISALVDGDPNNNEVQPGSILVVPGGFAGKLNSTGFCDSDVTGQYGCMPIDINEAAYNAVRDAIAAGVTVIESVGSGQMNLDDPAVYRITDIDLSNSANDSGAIVVSASEGANRVKHSLANCGARIDAYAWGDGVATAGYQISGYTWNGITAPLPPNTDPDAFFVDMFGGTSASGPMVAGAAALVQSYAKQVMGNKRYLTPPKLREILMNSGVAQSGSGCNIGMQPRIDVAFGLVDAEWVAWQAAYPELATNQMLTSNEIGTLRTAGLGIICVDGDPAASDPTCPDDSLYQPGSGIAETLDFDADGRADLVSWTRDRFKIDLSSVMSLTGEADGFGEWDLIIPCPPIQSDIVWPYVEDMNSDGRTDIVLYDKSNGTWYIKYMTSAILSGSGFSAWDNIISTNIQDQLDMNPWQTQYCRPHPGDYDGNGWVDLAVACSDGVWYIAHSSGTWGSSLIYDTQVNYLTAQQLQDAPGWAYLTAGFDLHNDDRMDMFVKVPDGLAEAGRLMVMPAPNFASDSFLGSQHIYGGNNAILAVSVLTVPAPSISIKQSDGSWPVADPNLFTPLDAVHPSDVYGGFECHPITADFDGDGTDDRTVLCPDEWLSAYSGNIYPLLTNGVGYRHVPTGYDSSEFTLPGRPYSGGVSYAVTQQLIQLFQDLDPSSPPPIPVDMVSISMCEMVSGGCQ